MSTTEDNVREQVPGWLLAQALCCLPFRQVIKEKDKEPQLSNHYSVDDVLIDADENTVTFKNRVTNRPVTLLLDAVAGLDTVHFIDEHGLWEPAEDYGQGADNLVLQFRRSNGISLVTRADIEIEVKARQPGEAVLQEHIVRAYAEQAKLYQRMAYIINKQCNAWRYNV